MSKALVVDDHPFIRATVKFLLKQEGFTEIDEAGNGADAVQKAREGRPDLVILDLAMPKLGGLEVISRIKALGLPCKILVLTSYLAVFFSTRCMRAGAMGFVAKTGELDELLDEFRGEFAGLAGPDAIAGCAGALGERFSEAIDAKNGLYWVIDPGRQGQERDAHQLADDEAQILLLSPLRTYTITV